MIRPKAHIARVAAARTEVICDQLENAGGDLLKDSNANAVVDHGKSKGSAVDCVSVLV